MNKFGLALKSKTIWTLLVMVVINLLPQLQLDQGIKDLINGVLTLLAAYFKLNPSENYNAPDIQAKPITQ